MPTSRPDAESLLEHKRFVRAIAGRLLDHEQDVEDVVQETWIRALRSAPAQARSLRAWLGRVARNLAISARRARTRRTRREHATAQPEGAPSAADAASRLEQHRLVVEAVLALDEPFRSVILLRFYDGLPPREIAASLGVPVATVRSRLRRGVEHMRGWLDARHGGDRSAWTVALLPLAGLRGVATAGAGGAAKTAAVLAAEGGIVKAKVIAVALVVCAASVGIVAWRAGPKGEPAGPPRAERDVRVAHAPPAAPSPAPAATTPAAPTERATVRVSANTGDPVASGALGSSKVVVGRHNDGKKPRAYRPAEQIDDAEHGALRVMVTPPRGVAPSEVSVLVTARTEGGRYETKRHAPGPDGLVEVRGLTPGSGTVSVTLAGRYRSTSVELEAGRFIEVEIGFPPGATVTGVVRHVERGPLPDLKLEVLAKGRVFEDRIRATTDAAGRYRLEGVPEGAHPVAITGKFIGYRSRPRATLVVAGTAPVARDFVLGQVRLHGVVREAGTGRPLPGVKVRLRADSVYADATTDAAGAYAFRDLAPGEFRLSFSRDGYGRAAMRSVAVPAEGTVTRDVELAPAAVLILDVRDASGRPVPGRHFLGLSSVEHPMTSTGSQIDVDAKGVGRNARIVPGEYALRLSANGYFPFEKRVDLVAGENRMSVRLQPTGEEEQQKDERPVSLRGTVRDAVTGKPIPGARVQIQAGLGGETRTDADGVYRFRGQPRGTIVTVVLSHDGHGIIFVRGIEITAVPTTRDFELAPAATLHLYVTDRANRPVVGGLHLSVRGGGEGTTRVGTGVEADADGHAVYRKIVPGTYELRVSADGVGEKKVNVEIVPGENTVRVRLE